MQTWNLIPVVRSIFKVLSTENYNRKIKIGMRMCMCENTSRNSKRPKNDNILMAAGLAGHPDCSTL